MRCKNEVLGVAFLSDIKDIIVTFGLDPEVQVEQGIKCFLDPRVYSSLALGHEDDKREVKPEHDGFCKIGGVIW